jgi:hypothetical protein
LRRAAIRSSRCNLVMIDRPVLSPRFDNNRTFDTRRKSAGASGMPSPVVLAV